jgi:UDP-3-O-[3-hydroxymyristoyl] glucosamine N-acyltransferase
VNPSVVLAPDIVIGTGVDLGPHVEAEAGVVFVGRSTVAGRPVVTEPVRIGADTVLSRQTSTGFDASIGGRVSFLPQVLAGRDLTAADNVIVGLGVIVGDGVRPGEGAVVGSPVARR